MLVFAGYVISFYVLVLIKRVCNAQLECVCVCACVCVCVCVCVVTAHSLYELHLQVAFTPQNGPAFALYLMH